MSLTIIRKLTLLTGLILALIYWSGAEKTAQAQTAQMRSQREDASEIARAASDKVGAAKQSAPGRTGIPMVVLEERHNSRIGQLQHAIILARLHDQHGLKDIVLEGYLKERPPINTDWFTKAVAEKTPKARARIAARFLKQGDISAAEFMKLVYTDVNLLRSETEDTYNVELPDGAPGLNFLLAIAQRSLRQGHVPTLQKLKREFDLLKGKPVAQEQKRIALIDFMLSVDSWTASRGKAYTNVETMMKMTGDEHLNHVREIKLYAERNSITVPPELQRGIEKEIAFWQKRMASNDIIVQAALDAGSSRSAGRVIAINIGSFHTDGVCQLLRRADRSYAVVTPLYAGNDTSDVTSDQPGDLTSEMYDRKNKRLPVFSQGLSALILKEVGGRKKPEPVLAETFFEAEAELSAFVTAIAGAILKPPSPPGEGKAPYGLFDSDFDGKHIRIIPAQIQLFSKQKGRSSAAIIPVVFKRSGARVWVGATRKQGEEEQQENVVAILEHALREVQAEKATPRRAEDKTGRVQMDSSTFAIIGKSPLTVKKALQSVS